MIEFVGLRAKTWAYLIDVGRENKKSKRAKKCVIKLRLMFKNYKDYLFKDKIILKSQKRFKGDCHDVYTKEINKIALNSNDDKKS